MTELSSQPMRRRPLNCSRRYHRLFIIILSNIILTERISRSGENHTAGGETSHRLALSSARTCATLKIRLKTQQFTLVRSNGQLVYAEQRVGSPYPPHYPFDISGHRLAISLIAASQSSQSLCVRLLKAGHVCVYLNYMNCWLLRAESI